MTPTTPANAIRHSKFLRPLKSTSVPRYFATVAVESTSMPEGDVDTHRLSRGHVSLFRRTPRAHFQFSSPATFWAVLAREARPGESMWVIVANARWAMHLLDAERELLAYWDVLTSWDAPGPMFIRAVEKHPPEGAKPKRIRIICHTNIWRNTSIQTLAEDLGMTRWNSAASISQVLGRAAQDWFDTLREHDLGPFQPTIARQGMAGFKRRIKRAEVLIHNNRTALEMEREAYRGGRNEARPVTLDKAWTIDIRSAYPTVMIDHTMPGNLRDVMLESEYGPESPDRLMKMVTGNGHGLVEPPRAVKVIARCRINQTERVFPDRSYQTPVYPMDRPFDTTLTTPELQFAHARGWIEHIGDRVFYDSTNVFSSYMRELVEIRAERQAQGRAGANAALKLLANSLYGKLGQRRRTWEAVEGLMPPPAGNTWHAPHPDDDTDDPEVHQWRWRAGKAWLLAKREGTESIPAVAAHVTAQCRLDLWALWNAAGYGAWYADTDGIIVDAGGLERVRRRFGRQVQAGRLKIDGPFEVEVIAPKQRRQDGEMVAAGLPKGATQVAPDEWQTDHWAPWQLGGTEKGEEGLLRVHRGAWRLGAQ